MSESLELLEKNLFILCKQYRKVNRGVNDYINDWK